MPPNTVYVGRPSKWGNPFVVGEDGTATECVRLFAADVAHGSKVGFILDEVLQLRGKNLACWCKIGEPCHADILLELANGHFRIHQ